MRSRYEKRAQKELEAEGYHVDWKIRPTRVPRTYQVDYWGCFDLLALKDGKIRFVSIKGRAGIPGWHKREVEEIKVPGIKEIWKRSTSKKRYWYKVVIK